MSLLLARAAVNDANIHFDRLYSYLIPAQLVGKVYPGSMVLVPFGRGNKAGLRPSRLSFPMGRSTGPRRWTDALSCRVG